MKNISAKEFEKILSLEGNNPTMDFIDVCSQMEYEQQHIKGVRNVPLDELEDHLDELKSKQTIYIHCFSGSRSLYAISLLKSRGIAAELVNVDGGIIAWHNAGLPLVR